MIYLDNMATTMLEQDVSTAMHHILSSHELAGNPASNHIYGKAALALVEASRAEIATTLDAKPCEIIFTSGATESNHLAILGIANAYQHRGRHIITSEIEHASVLSACAQLAEQGFTVTYLKPNPAGLISLEQVQSAVRADTILVSIIHVNNEIGVIQNLAPIAQWLFDKKIIFHTDAAQSIGKTPLSIAQIPAALISLSAHKVYGPKGVGALYVRYDPPLTLQPLFGGGVQEHGLRSGTQPTHQVMGMGVAFRLARENFEADIIHITALRDRLWSGLQTIPGIYLNGDANQRVPHNLNIHVAGVEGESLFLALSQALAISAGSACHSASLEPSPVLQAIGCSAQWAHASIRLSVGRMNTIAQMDEAIAMMQMQIERLRALSPLAEYEYVL